jgi:hypothetical protein
MCVYIQKQTFQEAFIYNMTNATMYNDLESRFRYRREDSGIVYSKDDHPPFNLQSQKRNGFIAGIIVLYLLVFSSDDVL